MQNSIDQERAKQAWEEATQQLGFEPEVFTLDGGLVFVRKYEFVSRSLNRPNVCFYAPQDGDIGDWVIQALANSPVWPIPGWSDEDRKRIAGGLMKSYWRSTRVAGFAVMSGERPHYAAPVFKIVGAEELPF